MFIFKQISSSYTLQISQFSSVRILVFSLGFTVEGRTFARMACWLEVLLCKPPMWPVGNGYRCVSMKPSSAVIQLFLSLKAVAQELFINMQKIKAMLYTMCGTSIIIHIHIFIFRIPRENTWDVLSLTYKACNNNSAPSVGDSRPSAPHNCSYF